MKIAVFDHPIVVGRPLFRNARIFGQTDGQTTYDSNTALALRASRGKNSKQRGGQRQRYAIALVLYDCVVTPIMRQVARLVDCCSAYGSTKCDNAAIEAVSVTHDPLLAVV